MPEWDEGPEPHDFKQETYDRLLDLADDLRDRAKEPPEPPDNCPHCGASLIGDPIPEKYRSLGWYGSATHWRREVGFEVPEVYDGMLFWACPDCGGRWHRFSDGHPLRPKAEPYVTNVRPVSETGKEPQKDE